MSCGETIYISNQSFVDEELDDHLDNGWYSDWWLHSKKELQNHYRDIVLKYFNPAGREVTKTVRVQSTKATKAENEKEILYVDLGEAIDYNFEVKVVRDRHDWIWTEPEVINHEDGLVDVSNI